MENILFAGTFDLTVLLLYAFFGFFLLLVLYLLREGRREGFPLEHDVTGALEPEPGYLFRATPKLFRITRDEVRKAPNYVRDTHVTNIARTAAWSGAPFEPTGDPMLAGVGPGSYAMREDRTDYTSHGLARIVPLRADPEYSVDKGDPDPRGFAFVGVDRQPGGVVTDLWVDRSEFLVRYLEVATIDAKGVPTGATVLVPMAMCVVDRRRRRVVTDSVLGAQVAQAPRIAQEAKITLREEERIVGYFGAGYLYATPGRGAPVL
jgi:photosynthetic reaction center H subunit